MYTRGSDMMTIFDNTADGMWTVIGLRIPDAKSRMMRHIFDVMADPEFYNKLRDRYERGSEEHDNEWLSWRGEVFVENAVEEILDCILYHAMNMVREDHVRKYGGPLTEDDLSNYTFIDASKADASGATIKEWRMVEDEMMGRATDPGSDA